MKKKEKSKKRELLPAHTIINAVNGENSAKHEILEHYRGYIIYILGVSIEKKTLNPAYVPTEDIVQEVSLEILKAIKNFE